MVRFHSKRASLQRTARGFTLIEILVALVIVAIITAIAIPNYRNHVIKTNRSTAESFMQQVANKQEQIMLDLRNYVAIPANPYSPANFTPAAPAGLGMQMPAEVIPNYQVSVAVNNTPGVPPTYTITALPINPPQNDPQCGTLTLTNAGVKACTGTACTGGTTQACWQ